MPNHRAWVQAWSAIGAPFELPRGKKAPPPTGVTGRHPTRTADPATVTLHVNRKSNLGIRLAPDVVGIDLDAYRSKSVRKIARELALLLPPTLITSRRFETDELSGIRYYRIEPRDTMGRTISVSGTEVGEIVHSGHGYVCVPPSRVDKLPYEARWGTNRKYRAVDTAAKLAKALDDLPMCPDEIWEYVEVYTPKYDAISGAEDHLLSLTQQQRETLQERAIDLLSQQVWDFRSCPEGSRDNEHSRLCFIIGGALGGGRITPEDADELAAEVDRACEINGADLATKRKTAEHIVDGASKSPWAELSEGELEALGDSVDDEEAELADPTVEAEWLDPFTGEPMDLWSLHPHLAAIRDAAHYNSTQPAAVLGAALARVSASFDPRLILPSDPPSPLCLHLAVVGRSGAGKTAAMAAAESLLRLPEVAAWDYGDGSIPLTEFDEDTAPIQREFALPTGEGLLEAFMGMRESAPDPEDEGSRPEKFRAQTYHRILVKTDELATILRTYTRSGSTHESHARSLWSGRPETTFTADVTRRRPVRPMSYSYAWICGTQPSVAVELSNATDEGTAQRFVWFATRDGTPIPAPGKRPNWPGSIEVPSWGISEMDAMGFEPLGDLSMLPGRYRIPWAKKVRKMVERKREYDFALSSGASVEGRELPEPEMQFWARTTQIADLAASSIGPRPHGVTVDTGAYNGHALLGMIRIAACVSRLLGNPPGIDVLSWRIAGAIYAHSNVVLGALWQVRDNALRRAAAAKRHESAETAAESAVRVAERIDEAAEEWLAGIAERVERKEAEGGPMKNQELNSFLGSRNRRKAKEYGWPSSAAALGRQRR